ncbi:MAG: tripartite tricarboxylate transporter substrate binding protein [Pseudolabrys sp.]|nr:tripartite tricarboxylate transporter substrate binding protein [Pseudolabrys sp.]
MRIAKALVCLLMLGAATGAQAQNYPDRPIRLVVSIAAGSVTDVIMRKAGPDLQQKLGQPLIIENRGGAAGILGAQTCAQAAPDGYTFCVIYHSTMSYNPLLFDKLPYAPEDLAPVTRLFFLTEGVFVSAATGINSIDELKAYAAAKPDGLNYATLGDGSFPDLFMRWLNNTWGSKIVGVPYKGGGPAAQALAANEVQVTRFGVGNFMGLIEAGKVKALAVAAEKRSPLLPKVPTLKEAGLGAYPGQGWWGLAAPKGTPAAMIDKINKAFVEVFKDPAFNEFLDKQSVVTATTAPAEFAAFLVEDRKAAESLIKLANSKRETYKPE